MFRLERKLRSIKIIIVIINIFIPVPAERRCQGCREPAAYERGCHGNHGGDSQRQCPEVPEGNVPVCDRRER